QRQGQTGGRYREAGGLTDQYGLGRSRAASARPKKSKVRSPATEAAAPIVRYFEEPEPVVEGSSITCTICFVDGSTSKILSCSLANWRFRACGTRPIASPGSSLSFSEAGTLAPI